MVQKPCHCHQKDATPNIGVCSKVFHPDTQREICDEVVIKNQLNLKHVACQPSGTILTRRFLAHPV